MRTRAENAINILLYSETRKAPVAGGLPRHFLSNGDGGCDAVCIEHLADESGEWGKRSEYYLITLVFHDQSKDISLALERYRQSLADYGLPDVPFDAGPLLTGHDAYEGMSLSERKRLLVYSLS